MEGRAGDAQRRSKVAARDAWATHVRDRKERSCSSCSVFSSAAASRFPPAPGIPGRESIGSANAIRSRSRSAITSTGATTACFGRSARDWRRSRVVRPKVVGGNTNPRTCRPDRGRVEVCNARYGQTGWLGIAAVWVKGKHITRAAVLMNDTYFDQRAYDSDIARRHVLCQEIGHTLGLDHYRGRSCMDDRRGLFDRGFMRPSGHDYRQLRRVYQHTDNRTSVSSLGSIDDGSNEADAPLATIAGSGGADIIVESFGGDSARITFVTWVDDLRLPAPEPRSP